jgi:S1/P1 Nuclease
MVARTFISLAIAAFAWMSATPDFARAWGNEGHQTIGLIAEHYLTASERAEVNRLLALPIDPDLPATIKDRAIWADAYRDSDRNGTQVRYKFTRNWHFVDLEIGKPDFTSACFGDTPLPPGADPSQGNPQECIVQKIDEFRTVLADKARPDAERARALNFLLHFVGDVHQPLHAAERQNDQGGNLVFIVTGKNATAGSNLHSLWDTAAVKRLGSTPETVAAALIEGIKPSNLTAWRKGTSRDWAMQSHQLANDVVYALPVPKRACQIRARDGTVTPQSCTILDAPYRITAAAKVQRQLQVAGIRLAWVISQALK